MRNSLREFLKLSRQRQGLVQARTLARCPRKSKKYCIGVVTLPMQYFLFICLCINRNLCQRNSHEYDDTAENFSGSELLTEDDPSGEDGEDGFEAHQQGCYGWIQSILTDDLQGVADTAGHDTSVQNGDPRIPGLQSGKPGVKSGQRMVHIHEKCRDQSDQSGDDKLDGG